MAWMKGKAAAYDACARIMTQDGMNADADHFMKAGEMARLFADQIERKEHLRD